MQSTLSLNIMDAAASIAGLISLADTVISKGYKLLSLIRNALKELDQLFHEITLLYGVLNSVHILVRCVEVQLPEKGKKFRD